MSASGFVQKNVARALYLPRYIAERSFTRWMIERPRYMPRPIGSEQDGNRAMRALIETGAPAAAGKIGTLELFAVQAYLSGDERRYASFRDLLHVVAGVFPPTTAAFGRFAEIYLESLSAIDLLAVWYNYGEASIVKRYTPRATLVELGALESYYHPDPWTRALDGKRVLVVHPFETSIRRQYERRREIWSASPDVLPEFELLTLKAPLSAGVVPSRRSSWPEVLDDMRESMSALRFDVCLVGAGAYSIPLVAHAKSMGAIGVHLGGSTQVLFGIRGRRWDVYPRVSRLYTPAWTRPTPEETPERSVTVEGGAYW